MRLSDIFEGLHQPLVCIDIQPEYSRMIHFTRDLMSFINIRNGRSTLMLVNGEDTGVSSDSISSIREYWEDYGLKRSCYRNLRIKDKGYGYLRSWMDSVPDDIIIRVIRYMARNKISDSRDISEGSLLKLFNGRDPIYDDPISINWLNFRSIGQYNDCLLCGGGRDECLREVSLMFDAYGIRYTLMNRFIY